MSMTPIGRAWSRESRTKSQTTGSFVQTWYQERDVKLETRVEITAPGACADVDPIDSNPTETSNNGAIYDSRTQWDPATHRSIKTNIVRVGATAWRNIRYTTSGEIPTYHAGG